MSAPSLAARPDSPVDRVRLQHLGDRPGRHGADQQNPVRSLENRLPELAGSTPRSTSTRDRLPTGLFGAGARCTWVRRPGCSPACSRARPNSCRARGVQWDRRGHADIGRAVPYCGQRGVGVGGHQAQSQLAIQVASEDVADDVEVRPRAGREDERSGWQHVERVEERGECRRSGCRRHSPWGSAEGVGVEDGLVGGVAEGVRGGCAQGHVGGVLGRREGGLVAVEGGFGDGCRDPGQAAIA